MISGGKAVFPDGVEVRYQEKPVPRLTSSTVWIWNAGKKTVKGSDIVKHDPLRLRFGGEILNVRIRKVSRDVVKIKADTPEEDRKTVCCGFEFLDPGDGGVLEVLHTGSAEAPKCTGTIMGLPKGLKYWRPSIISKWERMEAWLMSIAALIIGLEMTLGEQFLPFLTETLLAEKPAESDTPLPFWFRVPFGLLLLLSAVFHVRRLRRKSPSSLRSF